LLEQRQRHSFFAVAARLVEILEDADQLDDHREELVDLRRWLSLDRFDRRAAPHHHAPDRHEPDGEGPARRSERCGRLCTSGPGGQCRP
jgi:hypothetical protein